MAAPAFDYVIVGGGSAGAVTAARLSEDPAMRVCLIEAGGGGRGILVRAPVGMAAMLPRRLNNWAFETVPQPGLGGRRGYQPRGRALGGSSAINAMLYVRGQRQDYDGWADLGCEGWDWESVLPFFRLSEANERGADAFHGADGPLHVADQRAPRAISRAFVAAHGERQIAGVADFNTGENAGAGLFQCTQFHDPARRGERCSAAAAFLFPAMARPNLTVLTRARAVRVVFEGRRAVAVDYRQGRRARRVAARREVILSAGVFQSPQLLMLSGVGEVDRLQAHGIVPVHDLPGVGRNLQDHIDLVLGYRTRAHDTLGFSVAGGMAFAREAVRWWRGRASMVASPIAEAGSFLCTDPALGRPDVQTHFLIALMDDHGRRLRRGHGYACHVCVLRPRSRGEVFLESTDPLAAPGIDPHFLEDPHDLATLIAGARMVRDILHAPAMAPWRGQELFGIRDGMTDADWERVIRRRADSVYHPVGTCAMGTGAMAVVDPRLRVRGLNGLRVADASIMPRIVSGNTGAAAIMIGEKCAAMVREDAK